MLKKMLNSRATALLGIFAAASTAARAIFDPKFILALYYAISHLKHGNVTPADQLTLAGTITAFLGIAFLLYFGDLEAPLLGRADKP